MAVPEGTSSKPINISDDAKPKQTNDGHNNSSQSDANAAKSAIIPKYILCVALILVLLLAT